MTKRIVLAFIVLLLAGSFASGANGVLPVEKDSALDESVLGELPADKRPQVGQPLEDFTLADLGGTEQSLGKYIGEKGVLLVYWAAWCSSCQEELPVLNGYYDSDGPFQILAANFREPVATIEAFKQEHGLAFPLVPDPKGELRRKYGLTLIPALFFVDRNGILRHFATGEISLETLEHWLQVISDTEPETVNKEVILNQIINQGKTKLKRLINDRK